ncbi:MULTISPECIES: iron-siderophore ABC transporter substrate-binding protein [unclassified Plantactinospora]|uniref:iron-siderophore ABC transporter substrate-binding protein n=1 Tax=unclassified Plantactinospora TaxID=2631981 RepID=UPI000D16B1EE|nr:MULTISPECIES: iron-siderophore ABC transporter substrate-binding protein [unclassified Plantactinospora]AVT28965.1 iron ABC transporter substrate-binding protein [Plantactinospora sp. BC1]AVT35368.1 iron ABC transporter substrate-binding protein [Plantactinospora sp. BB1]
MSTTPARTKRPRPVARLTAALAVLVVGLAGCGGGDDGADPAPSASAGGTFPVTVEHKYGSTEITKAPTRVVTLGLSDQDPVLALGVVPVGAIDWFLERPYGKWPWAQPLWGSTPPEIVGERDDYNLEKIAALRPDLIIGLYSGMTQEQYQKLSQLAPTVAQPKGFADYAAPWQEMTRQAGRALGKPEQADKLIADVDARFAKARQEHPGFAGKTVAVVDPYEAGKYAVFAPSDPKVVFMTQLGFTVPESIVQAAGKEYAAEIGSERLDLVDVDKLLFLTSDASAEPRVKADKVYATLDVAKQNRAVFLPYENPPIGGALSFSTVLSVPYALDQMLPLLGDG